MDGSQGLSGGAKVARAFFWAEGLVVGPVIMLAFRYLHPDQISRGLLSVYGAVAVWLAFNAAYRVGRPRSRRWTAIALFGALPGVALATAQALVIVNFYGVVLRDYPHARYVILGLAAAVLVLAPCHVVGIAANVLLGAHQAVFGWLGGEHEDVAITAMRRQSAALVVGASVVAVGAVGGLVVLRHFTDTPVAPPETVLAEPTPPAVVDAGVPKARVELVRGVIDRGLLPEDLRSRDALGSIQWRDDSGTNLIYVTQQYSEPRECGDGWCSGALVRCESRLRLADGRFDRVAEDVTHTVRTCEQPLVEFYADDDYVSDLDDDGIAEVARAWTNGCFHGYDTMLVHEVLIDVRGETYVFQGVLRPQHEPLESIVVDGATFDVLTKPYPQRDGIRDHLAALWHSSALDAQSRFFANLGADDSARVALTELDAAEPFGGLVAEEDALTLTLDDGALVLARIPTDALSAACVRDPVLIDGEFYGDEGTPNVPQTTKRESMMLAFGEGDDRVGVRLDGNAATLWVPDRIRGCARSADVSDELSPDGLGRALAARFTAGMRVVSELELRAEEGESPKPRTTSGDWLAASAGAERLRVDVGRASLTASDGTVLVELEVEPLTSDLVVTDNRVRLFEKDADDHFLEISLASHDSSDDRVGRVGVWRQAADGVWVPVLRLRRDDGHVYSTFRELSWDSELVVRDPTPFRATAHRVARSDEIPCKQVRGVDLHSTCAEGDCVIRERFDATRRFATQGTSLRSAVGHNDKTGYDTECGPYDAD